MNKEQKKAKKTSKARKKRKKLEKQKVDVKIKNNRIFKRGRIAFKFAKMEKNIEMEKERTKNLQKVV